MGPTNSRCQLTDYRGLMTEGRWQVAGGRWVAADRGRRAGGRGVGPRLRLFGHALDAREVAMDFDGSRDAFLGWEEAGLDEADLSVELFRVDVAQLPFNTQSLSAVHAGAALHCWVQLETGLEEIRRVLKPGAPFFATTFLVGAMGSDSLPKAVRDRGYRGVAGEGRGERVTNEVIEAIHQTNVPANAFFMDHDDHGDFDAAKPVDESRAEAEEFE